MSSAAVVRSDDPKAVRQTRALIDCMREFVRGSYTAVRDCAKYPDTLWLEDVPEGVLRSPSAAGTVLFTAKHHPARQAPALPAELEGWVSVAEATAPGEQDPALAARGPGHAWVEDEHGDLTEVHEIPQEDAAEVTRAYRRWLPLWRRWASAERAAQPHRALYQRLYRMAKKIQQDGEILEAVLAVGLLTIGTDRPTGRVHRHLLTAPVTLRIAPDTVDVTVSLAPENVPRLEDGDFLSESDGYSSELLAGVRSQAEDTLVHPLAPDAQELLRTWSQRAFGADRAVPFDTSLHRPAGTPASAPQLHWAPALLLRERGQSAVINFYDGIARHLAQPGARSPLGLAQILYKLEPAQRTGWGSGGQHAVPPALGPDPLYPLPTNEAQRDVLERLQHDTGVVVQGPPGTGKTHTIANLIIALLADGKRVLVTSEKGQALRVLRDELPPALRDLCVLQGDRRDGDHEQLQQSIRALSQLSATTSPQRLAERTTANDALRAELKAERARLRDQLRALRETEWYEHSEIAPGYQGRLAQIVHAIQAVAPQYDWLPAVEDQDDTAPLANDEAQRLLSLIARHGPDILNEQDLTCPDPAALPAPETVEEHIHTLDQAVHACSKSSSAPLVQQLAGHGEELLRKLEQSLDQGARALLHEGLPPDPTAWSEGDWTYRALADALGRRSPQLWASIRTVSDRAQHIQDALVQASFPDVDLPQDLTPAEEAQLVAAGRDLQQFLREGRRLRKWLPKTAVQKEARPLLHRCRVDGRAPTSHAQVAAVVLHLEMRRCARQLNERWTGVAAPATQHGAEGILAELLDRRPRLQAIDDCAAAVHQVHDLLTQAGIPASTRTFQQWQTVRTATADARLLREAWTAEQNLADLLAQVPPAATHSAPQLTALHRAATTRDPQAYAQAMDELSAAYHRQADRRETRKLMDRLTQAHPLLARHLIRTPTDPAWETRLSKLSQAWAWRRAHSFVDLHLAPGREDQLEGQLAQVEAHLRTTEEQLAADRALTHCLQRMTTAQKQALAAYATAISHAGKGTSASSKRHRRQARSAMHEARGAVPAWVMPIRQVTEMIAPEPDAFDVVIVDEASQVGLDGLLLLWLAPRIIVVGDDKQCSPLYMNSRHDRMQRIFDERLTDLAPWQRTALDPKSSLYDLLSQRFTEVIRLTEHFRCMPEIIQWSSSQFYSGNELVLLRQHGVDRLPPLKVVHVPEGHCEGRLENLTNRPEADRLIAQLRQLTEDPAYADRSIGVIVLRSGAQVRLLQNLLDIHIDAPARERHRIRVGTAESFQGAQRDVVLLSMAIDGKHTRAMTSKGDRQRFNVAASRARDQMWLFTSVTADQLSSKDLRRSLLAYMQSPPAQHDTHPRLANVTPDQQCAPFQSLFEQRVFLRIRDRGYHVVPQWKVSSKYIDLVVIGKHTRLAVECDGSPYHSTVQQIHDDYERERELRRAGWDFWRVRSSQFELDPDAAMSTLWSRLRTLDIHPLDAAQDESGTPHAPTWTPIALPDDEADEQGLEPLDTDEAPGDAETLK
ncbi:AAA domain-containing protein [Streptomyces sp. NPDC047117]|uniref:AAA domain-containing protein n=1 Tax=Streptomyces sp. NPDC047117 TaxID=3155379 RepID=UPI00340B71CF